MGGGVHSWLGYPPRTTWIKGWKEVGMSWFDGWKLNEKDECDGIWKRQKKGWLMETSSTS
jgi:hypothetical protein